MRRLVVVALLAAVLPGGTSAANPWQLACASMPNEQPLPAPVRAAARAFFPWVSPAATALATGPVYVVALSSHSVIARDGDATDSAGYYLHRALVAIAPS